MQLKGGVNVANHAKGAVLIGEPNRKHWFALMLLASLGDEQRGQHVLKSAYVSWRFLDQQVFCYYDGVGYCRRFHMRTLWDSLIPAACNFLDGWTMLRETEMQTNEEENNGRILSNIWTYQGFKYGWNYFNVRALRADASITEQWPTLLLMVADIRGDIKIVAMTGLHAPWWHR